MALIIIIVIIVILVLAIAGIYNGLVRARMMTKEAWSQIDVQLKRRNDLIPNLLETVKGYARFEQGTLEKVTEMRSKIASGSAGPAETMQASDQLSGALKTVFAVSEAYPDLKANTNYQQLMLELSATEDKIAVTRQLYNSATANYNMKLQTFPTNIFAGMFNFQASEFLQTPEAEKVVPNVKFDENGL
ncbi:LemA family protein [Lactococcus nasutitermitis]|uniref:LemA family protein n=1 Tax=Lactococcus nasutitermitis TaxID=1652957 RepID=A0ABV9JFY8_9LACT|nr:LemA family protein [Lactococcus nasutitermitis]